MNLATPAARALTVEDSPSDDDGPVSASADSAATSADSACYSA